MEVIIQIKSSEKQKNPVSRLMEEFYTINPMLNFGNKTYRTACELMIKKFGIDGALAMAQQIIAEQGKPYFPVVTNPYQMKEKLAQCKIYFDKNKVNIFEGELL